MYAAFVVKSEAVPDETETTNGRFRSASIETGKEKVVEGGMVTAVLYEAPESNPSAIPPNVTEAITGAAPPPFVKEMY